MAVSCRISWLSFGIGSYALVAGGAQEGATAARRTRRGEGRESGI
jgi:hypothetical protein